MVDHSSPKQLELQKFLGPQLIDAGLLTPDQVKVIYADQESSGLPFGDIAVSRGWVKEQTIDYVARKFALTNHLMATITELRGARDALVRELDAYRKKPQTFSQKESTPGSWVQPKGVSGGQARADRESDDTIDWIG